MNVETARKKIIARANKTKDGWFTHDEPKLGAIRIARLPLMWYVFRMMTNRGEMLPKYEPVSRMGLKMAYDNNYHTDAWLSTGLPLADAYDYNKNELWNRAIWAFKEQNQHIVKSEFLILAKGRNAKGYVFGRVYDSENTEHFHTEHILYERERLRKREDKQKVIAIPTAGIEYDLHARKADIVITETGGKLCHLATVMRERNKTLLMVKDATKRFGWGMTLAFDFDEYTIKSI